MGFHPRRVPSAKSIASCNQAASRLARTCAGRGGAEPAACRRDGSPDRLDEYVIARPSKRDEWSRTTLKPDAAVRFAPIAHVLRGAGHSLLGR
jgi:hypothetical protein